MESEHEHLFSEERSDMVRDILGKPPNWVVRIGITVVFVVVSLLFIGAAVLSYNDITTARITITSKNPPIYLKANVSGRLTNVLVEENQYVEEGQILAEIENTANFEDVLFLKRQLENFNPENKTLDSLKKEFPSSLNLGTMQLAYIEFLTKFQNFMLFKALSPNKKESQIILQQLKEQKTFLSKQEDQRKILEEDLELSKKTFERSSFLHKKGVISQAEYEEASRSYLSDKQRHETFLGGISNTRIAIANFNSLLTKSTIQGKEFQSNYRQGIDNALQSLSNELLLWEQRFLIKSPIDGKVTIFDIWSTFQNVEAGEVIFTIVPIDIDKIIGRLTLPIRNSGKVKEGQKVIVKLDNYPFEEWGSLEGRIISISEVPKLNQVDEYTLYVEIDNLRTSYNKTIEFKQAMQGSAEIVLEELTLLQRILYQLRGLFSR